jgi:glucose-6-phosphate 1-dehydrogenase
MKGDPSLFQRADSIEAGWRIVQPVLDAWKATKDAVLPTYVAGSAGPQEAAELLERDGRHWRPVNGAKNGDGK